MKRRAQRNINRIDNILQVTKNTVQLDENYNNYYLHKDNSLYKRQLPLLIQKSKILAISIRKKENEKNLLEDNQNRSESTDKYLIPLNDIRNAQIRSKKLPPLCPFYNDKGELLRSVVTTSKLVNNKYLNDDNFFAIRPKITLLNVMSKKKSRNSKSPTGCKTVEINFDEFQNDFFYEPDYSNHIFNDSEIFGKKEHYFELIKNKINEFKIIENNIQENEEFKKVKIFEKNKHKKNISLVFESLSVKIYELNSSEEQEKEKENENNDNCYENDYGSGKKDVNNDIPVFEYNLPFVYLPIFYYKGEEKFKIILSKLIQWDNENNKFALYENPDSLFKDVLINCVDYGEENKEEQKIETTNTGEVSPKPLKQKLAMTMGAKKYLKKESGGYKFNPLGSTIIEEQNLSQTMAANIPNTYITNLDESKKKYDVISQSSIYPTKKDYNYINCNIFEFLWLTPKKNFKVCISSPIATINIPKNNIKVKKYIDFELLFYLYENDFKNWDFFLVKYLSSYKSFRALLEEINSINQSFDKDFYLTRPRIKNYSFNNTKIINIATIKQKNILENLIEGIMEGKKEDEETKNKLNNSNTIKNESLVGNEKEELSNDELTNSTLVQKCFIAIIRFVDIKTTKAHEFKIYFNFNQFIQFQNMENYIDKISFLIKFIDINYIKKSVSFDYKSLDNFDEKEWIKDYIRYNNQYLMQTENKNNLNNDYHRTYAEYLGMSKNSVIQIEIYTPIILARIMDEVGNIKDEKVLFNNNYQDQLVHIKKDDILEMSRIFYNCYEEEQRNQNGKSKILNK